MPKYTAYGSSAAFALNRIVSVAFKFYAQYKNGQSSKVSALIFRKMVIKH